MTPKTKEELRVTALSGTLPNLSAGQVFWLNRKVGVPKGYVNRKHAWCGECGFPLPKETKSLVGRLTADSRMICPFCGKELDLTPSHGSKQCEKFYFTVVSVCKEYQVFRHFLVSKISCKGMNFHISYTEVVQNWINPSGKETVLARSTTAGYYCDQWILSSDMSVKRPVRSHGSSIYDINPNYIYPYRRYIPTLKRNGFYGDFFDLAPSTLTIRILTNSDCEFLLKTRQISLLKYACVRGLDRIPHKESVNICVRHRYTVKSADLWLDMMDTLFFLGKDIRSPFYVCPSDLRSAHDWAVEQKERAERKRRLEEERETARVWEERYRAEKGRFFSLSMSDGRIFIRPLLSVSEFAEEGDRMHHCVFANGYYMREDSLILTARDMEGNRLETVEIDLKGFSVVQSRGACNSMTKWHDQIIDLVTGNMHRIREICLSSRISA